MCSQPLWPLDMSRAMLERYSHIRMFAKRDAVQCLTVEGDGTGSISTGLSTKSTTVEHLSVVQ
jgi:hypothetical protein